MSPDMSLFWAFTGLVALVVCFVALAAVFLFVRQRRAGWAACALVPAAFGYWLEQVSVIIIWQAFRTPAARAAAAWLEARPAALIISGLIAIAAGAVLALMAARRGERARITPMSVKEAVDSLPSGVCVYLPGGRVILINRAMERLGRAVMDEVPWHGEALSEALRRGPLPEGVGRASAEGAPLITLRDGTAWLVAEDEITLDGGPARRLLASDVTELYDKTRTLRRMNGELAALNARLVEYNRDIVALTAEKELLSARVRLHDQMGEDLLTMKRYIHAGGTDDDRRAIEGMLRRNVAFLMTGQQGAREDEYELMISTAARLGVTVAVEGPLPAAAAQKHVVAAAIHECFTNTLRHAHGDTLRVTVAEDGNMWRVTLKNNGVQPAGPVSAKGGLRSVKALAERAGGRMTIRTSPEFAVCLDLPREVTR